MLPPCRNLIGDLSGFARRRVDISHKRLGPALSQAVQQKKEAQDALALATARGTEADVQAAQLHLAHATITVLQLREAQAERDAGMAGLNLAYLDKLASIDATMDDGDTCYLYDADRELVRAVDLANRRLIALAALMVTLILLLVVGPTP